MKLSKGELYILISFILWVIVEFITVWHTKLEEWTAILLPALIQYLFIILIFYYFIFRKEWHEKRVFIVMLVVMYVFEILWQNALLFDIFLFVPASLLLISIWGFLAFIPLWLVNKSFHEHKLQMVYYLLWVLVAVIMFLLF